MNKNDCYQ